MNLRQRDLYISIVVIVGLYFWYYSYSRQKALGQSVYDEDPIQDAYEEVIPAALLNKDYFPTATVDSEPAPTPDVYDKTPTEDWIVQDHSWVDTVEAMKKSDVFNRTLGFEQVYAIGLPERTDKRDAIALMSSYTDFDVQWADGVQGVNVPDQALPLGWDRHGINLESHLGSWRGHMNVIRGMVEKRTSTALILEDDMDWDVSLKEVLASFAFASRKFQESKFQIDPKIEDESPYGQNWDLLWLGACWNSFSERMPEWERFQGDDADERKIFIHNDPTVAPIHRLVGNPRHDWNEFPSNTRVVYRPGGQVCSFAYALSLSGARKALEYLSIRGAFKPFDQHLDDLCKFRENGMRCLSVTPAIFEHHRPRGPVALESDILKTDNQDVREVGFTENIYYSTRMNLNNLVNGRAPQPQWID